jgi:hypothetical protein
VGNDPSGLPGGAGIRPLAHWIGFRHARAGRTRGTGDDGRLAKDATQATRWDGVMMLLMLMVGAGFALVVTAMLMLRYRMSGDRFEGGQGLESLLGDVEKASTHPSAQAPDEARPADAPVRPGYLVEWSIRRRHPAKGRREQEDR